MPAASGAAGGPSLPELWQQILSGLELPSTRMLLSQQAMLVRLDSQRAVVRVSSNWMPMVQSRLPLLETAVAKALGSPRQLMLEGGDPTTLQAAPAPPAPAAPSPQAPGLGGGSGAPEAKASQPPVRTEAAVQSASAPITPAPANAPASAPEAQPLASQPAAEQPTPAAPAAPAVATPAAAAAAPVPAGRSSADNRQQQQLDEKAKRLADFFNGEVISLEEPPEAAIAADGAAA